MFYSPECGQSTRLTWHLLDPVTDMLGLQARLVCCFGSLDIDWSAAGLLLLGRGSEKCYTSTVCGSSPVLY